MNYEDPNDEILRSLNGLIKNRNGVFVSIKQQGFLLRVMRGNIGFDPIHAGIELLDGFEYATVEKEIRFADYGTRSWRRIGYVFEFDTTGVVRQWRLHYSYSSNGGSSCVNAKKTELLFERPEGVVTSHLVEEAKAVEAAPGNVYIGAVKDKVSLKVKFVSDHTFFTKLAYGSTSTQFITMKVVDTGETVVWNSSKFFDLEKGEQFTITGTIKAHKEFRGVKQTVLTRCKIVKG